MDVTVTNPDTQSDTLVSGYTYMLPAPTVTGVTPSSGPTGGGTAVTITGTNFVSGATVTFGGTPATGVTFVSATQIDVTTPAHAPGAVDVTVTNPDTQSGTFIDGYTYDAPPAISSVTPNNGPQNGGTAVTITGTNFVSGATVTFGVKAATTVTFVSATQIDVTTPPHAAGAVDVTVTNPDTQSGTLTNGYTYNAGTPDLQQVHYRWRNDDGGESWGYLGTGADGAVTISTTQNINTDLGGTVTTVSSFGSATGGTTLDVASATGFAAGDEVLLINLQGDGTNNGNAGNYEFLKIQSISVNTLTFTAAIQKLYGATTSNLDLTGQSVIVQRVPQWTTVTINSGGTLTANSWDGSSGGVVVFRATGSVTVNPGGAIDVSGLGYRGGAGGSTGGGINGESYDGTVGSGGDDTVSGATGGNPGTAGGGGSSNYDGTSPEGTRGGGGGGGNSDGNNTADGAGGAGGGGYGDGGGGGGGGADASGSGGAGGAGGTITDTNAGGGGGHGGDDTAPGEELGTPGGAAGSAGAGTNGGAAGSGVTKTGQGGGTYPGGVNLGGTGAGGGGGGGQYGAADLTTLFPGSGGGGGGGHDNGPVTGKVGGDGGGIIFIIADSVTVAGSITSNGGAGVAAGTREGAGGGGSGGSILIQANSASLGTSLVTTTGGSGGAASAPGGGGGAGGIGRIRVEADTITGTANPSASTGGTPVGSGSGASWAAAEDTPLTGLAKSTTKRLRIEISNDGGSGSIPYRLEVSEPNPASCDAATYTRVDTSTHWNMVASTHFADGDPTENIASGLTDENTTFVAGQLKESTDETSGITLSGTEFTEIEYAVQATASATSGATYCFRLTDAGDDSTFTYAEATYGKVTLMGPPILTDVAPSSGPTAGGTSVTITGTNFVSGATVTFGGT
ncbi:MAG TPA: IPT/TIG domain-containing protein, partial [Verrucomicrobiae bacterium]|nr:IPT/TIG domain-containing protein [Verrucomicrobiae bacterium]